MFACLGIVFYCYPLFHLAGFQEIIPFLTAHTVGDVRNSLYPLGFLLTMIAFIKGADDIGNDWSDFESVVLNTSTLVAGILTVVLGLLKLIPWLFSLPLQKCLAYVAWFAFPVATVIWLVATHQTGAFKTLLELPRRRPLGMGNARNQKKRGMTGSDRQLSAGNKQAAAESKETFWKILFRDPKNYQNVWIWCVCILTVLYLVLNFYSHIPEDRSFMVMVTRTVAGVIPFELSNIPSWGIISKILLCLFVFCAIMCLYSIINSKNCDAKTFAIHAALLLAVALLTRVLLNARPSKRSPASEGHRKDQAFHILLRVAVLREYVILLCCPERQA